MKNGKTPVVHDDLAVVLCGEQGQGIQTVEQTLTQAVRQAGYHVFSTKEYMSRIRGGAASTLVRISSKPVAACVDRIDILVPLHWSAVSRLKRRVTARTRILGDRDFLKPDRNIVDVPFTRLAAAAGGKLVANTVATGTVLGLMGIPIEPFERILENRYAAKGPDTVEKNKDAARKGHAEGRALADRGVIRVDLRKDERVLNFPLMSGGEAVVSGAIAGGCNFLSSYPMSPSTSVLVGMAAHARNFGMVVEQAEDEIAAINMALGASYAGARAMVTTSGGGFALMAEGVSLAGMIETPVVIHLSQRPGPATGMPTRTEQADLELALYAGHGEFPRVLFAPGSLRQAFDLTRRAFDVADRFQIPVVVLSDQVFMDSLASAEPFEWPTSATEPQIVRTDPGYLRYRLTPDGVSPRGIPGWGDGLVRVDSDEHTEEGVITEDMDLRERMVDKRNKKMRRIVREAIRPERIGRRDAKTLVVCWGSNRAVVKETLQTLGDPSVAALHFSQVYPLPPGTAETLRQARTVVAVENNATGQLCKLIRRETGHAIERRILKYNGLAFTVEEVAAGIRRHLKRRARA